MRVDCWLVFWGDRAEGCKPYPSLEEKALFGRREDAHALRDRLREKGFFAESVHVFSSPDSPRPSPPESP